MKTIPRLGALGATVALATAGFFAVSPAGAETHNINSNLTGGLTINLVGPPASTAELGVPDGSTFVGNYDDTSGDLTGTVSIEGGTTTVAVPGVGDAVLSYEFKSAGPITGGTISPTGDVSFTDTETLHLTSATVAGNELPLPDTCAFGPIALEYAGTYDDTTNKVDVKSTTVPVPALADDACGGLTGIVQGVLGDATVQASLGFTVGEEDITPPIPPVIATTINEAGIVSNGCDVTVPIDFGAAGDYTLTISTANDRKIGTAQVDRDAAGSFDAHVMIDKNHGTKTGDMLDITLTDSKGATVASAHGSVTNPEACAPTQKPTTKPLVNNTAPPAKSVSANPTFTG